MERNPYLLINCTLHFTAEGISDGDTRFKCAPPIREADNRERLWGGLENGAIDFIASDHSPCSPELKKLETGDFRNAWGGISSLQFTLSVIWTECKKRNYSLVQLADWLCKKPAKLLWENNFKGEISPGFFADLVIWDPDATFVVEPSVIHHKNKLTPYECEKLFGVMKKTFLRGRKIFENGEFLNGPSGKTLLRNHNVYRKA